MYDYWLGGKDNFAADREAAEAVIAVRPGHPARLRENREFLARAVRYLAAEAVSGSSSTSAPASPPRRTCTRPRRRPRRSRRVVYVDNDPIVLAHARALLTSTAEGATAYLDADLREPDPSCARPRQTLDFSQPVGSSWSGILHLIPDDEEPEAIVGRLMAALPSGSYLVITHPASDVDADRDGRGRAAVQRAGSARRRPGAAATRCPLLRRAGAGRAGGGAAARWRPDPDGPPPAGESSALGRRGPQAVTLSPGRR